VQRFTGAEHWVHRSNAIVFTVCIVTAACLYFGPLAVVVGRRELMKTIHVAAGIALPLPLLVGWFMSTAFRDDVRRLSRFAPRDWEWLRRRDRRTSALPVGKFNAGQKLNSAFTAGAIAVMLGTGLIMRFFGPFPLAWRTGATFVHDWLALTLLVVIAGHLFEAMRDPESMVGMRTGRVSRAWARSHHPGWAEELRTAAADQPADADGGQPLPPGAG
jgi:formate dehydrogenase subunit gamma